MKFRWIDYCKYFQGPLGHSKSISLARSFSKIVISHFLWFEIPSPRLHLPHLPSSVEDLAACSREVNRTISDTYTKPRNNLLLFPSSAPDLLFQWRSWPPRLSVMSCCTCALGPIYSILPGTSLNGLLTSFLRSSTSSSLKLLSISIHNAFKKKIF